MGRVASVSIGERLRLQVCGADRTLFSSVSSATLALTITLFFRPPRPNALSERAREIARVAAREEPPECAAELFGLLRSRLWVERERASDHVVDRHEAWIGVARPRVSRGECGLNVFDLLATERRLA